MFIVSLDFLFTCGGLLTLGGSLGLLDPRGALWGPLVFLGPSKIIWSVSVFLFTFLLHLDFVFLQFPDKIRLHSCFNSSSLAAAVKNWFFRPVPLAPAHWSSFVEHSVKFKLEFGAEF